MIMGDSNTHNVEWLHVVTEKTDKGGAAAQEFCEMYGLQQLVDFRTRGGNTLDLIISSFNGTVTAMPHLGSSDHISIKFEINTGNALLCTPQATVVYDWHKTPWDHIKGAIERALADWDSHDFVCQDGTEHELSIALQKISK